MQLTEIIAYLAAICTTVAFVPQAIMVWKTNNTVSISLTMYSVFITGLLLWMVYGFLTWQWPIIIANIITTCLAATIWWRKVRNIRIGKN